MPPGAMPKPTEDARDAFRALIPEDDAVNLRPMFGNLAAFVNGNMFAGLFGEALFVRLSESEAAEARQQGARDFEPMPGRSMKGYVTVPGDWKNESDAAAGWIQRSLSSSRALPPKEAKPKAARRR